MNKSIFIKGGLREGFKDGTSKLADRVCYGYSKSENGSLAVNEYEAKIVREIFERYFSGDSLGQIADYLAERNVPSPTGKARWNRQALTKLLSNEKYAGSVMLQKTVTENGRQVRNDGVASKFLYSNSHPPIIPAELFQAVQDEKLRRSNVPQQTPGKMKLSV
jgi:hypothetical protein